ncbi:MAG: pyridoxamine 5'-phosphate oxidase family protein [Paludibacteraceae bacterium]
MNYNNTNVRRQDRLMPENEARELLDKGEYGYLSMIADDGKPYGIPISYVWDGKESIYFHVAPEGRKLRAIMQNSSVSFCVTGSTNVISNKFTTEYQSIVISGNIHRLEDNRECFFALELLLDKYSPNDKTVGMKYAENSFLRTRILRMDVTEWSGKRKKLG